MSLVKALDCASYQPRDLSGLIAEYQPQHVIVKLYQTIETVSQDHSRAQIQSARENGCSVGVYLFLYPGTDMARAVNEALDLCASVNLVAWGLWLDVEEFNGANLTAAELATAVNHCEALETPVGLYTSRYMWSKLGNPTGFEALPVWAAQYDHQPTLESVLPIPNLPLIVGHQYQGDPLDLSVILSEYTVVAQPSPCAALTAALDARLARRPWKAVTKAELAALRALVA